MTPDKIYLSKLVMAGAEILDKPVSDGDVEYIRADVIRNEIERLKEDVPCRYHPYSCASVLEAYEELLSFLSTLESEKPVTNDLKEAASRFSKNASNDHNYHYLRIGFIFGAKWQKEQMMKDGLEGKIYGSDGEYWIETDIDENIKGKEGDKVRVVVLKKED